MGDVVGRNVAPHMVHPDEGLVQSIGCRLGKIHPHQHRADEAGGVGDRHRVDVLFSDPGLPQGPVGQGRDSLHMLAGGDLRDDPPVGGMHIGLGGDGVGEHRPPVPHHRHGGLIAGGLHSQNNHDPVPSFSWMGMCT